MSDSESRKDGEMDEACSRNGMTPKNVPVRLWEKFKALEKRTNETTRRSTEKRIKHLQKTALENVARALTCPEDREIVQIPLPAAAKAGPGAAEESAAAGSSSAASAAASRKRPLGNDAATDENAEDRPSDTTPGSTSEEKEWRRVRGLMGINDHLAGVSHGSLGPRTVLETKIEAAIAAGDFKAAEEMSDHMATREFGEKIAKAIDAKNFLQHKQEEEEMAKAKRKKKLHWGFEAKHRWETKSNM